MPPKVRMAKRKSKQVVSKPPVLDDSSGGSTNSDVSAAYVIETNQDSYVSDVIPTVSKKKQTSKKKKAPVKGKPNRQYCSNGKLDINTCTITSLRKVFFIITHLAVVRNLSDFY